MGDQKILKTYGNTDLPEGTKDRPLVTFALFAYNQEKYIREAVEGAFSQTYFPLEIILSDDCSNDRTFEIMEGMAREYMGAHLIRVRKGPENLGTIDHVLTIAGLAQGDLVVVAAGDDISVENRAELLTESWKTSSAVAVFSGRTLISDDGEDLCNEPIIKPMDRIQDVFRGYDKAKRYNGKVRNVPGYSAAYERSFLNSIPKCGNGALNEDALTTVIANLDGSQIESVALPLVKHRLSSTSVSVGKIDRTLVSFISSENVTARFSRSSIKFFPYLFSVIKARYVHGRNLNSVVRELRLIYRESYFISECHGRSFLGRLALMSECRNFLELKIVVSRLFGVSFLAFLKMMRGWL